MGPVCMNAVSVAYALPGDVVGSAPLYVCLGDQLVVEVPLVGHHALHFSEVPESEALGCCSCSFGFVCGDANQCQAVVSVRELVLCDEICGDLIVP